MFAVENKPFRSLPNKKIFISSAKSFGVAEVNAFWMSFTYSKKRSGPRTEPWGTPQPMTEVLEHAPLTDVNCLRPLRNVSNQLRALPLIP